ncbi:Imidazole glycerol phosphate synthase amidotransferase subunit [Nitrincola lacisaponensis]|uniref:Imidazole glycerol phosphate synthase subunit HisH n=1 Tax=Nitrincola lacisaponensis TaxID=267850 RepID=A0A063Y4S5_9GAMM|nr:imidazole glycerol phosphate synthase subunit HisH [Nitrincola lacisaponensis]KDE41333.1 Imidazole glycerol phosphate synthase amidotransferase subunit [Nitrincola lacisaponensis]
MSSIAVIDYGMGNLHSVAKALEHVQPGVEVRVTADPQQVRDADRVLLPGVGAIRDCMAEIRRLGVDAEVAEAIRSGKPFLGICVGFQALMDSSEENGGVDCLAEFPGQVKFFGEDLQDQQGQSLKVPHMGWNQVKQACQHPLWDGIADLSRFYFVHSYYVRLAQAGQVAATCEYGVPFDVALAHKNVFAVQFHPEKSQQAGLKLLQNFLNWDGQL